MKQSSLAFRIQLTLFIREKGMLIFYLISIAVLGVAAPFFLHSVESVLPMAALFTVLYIKPIVADSLAGERERRTLESLLSAPISGNRIIWGKFFFCLLFSLGFYSSNGTAANIADTSSELLMNR